MALEALGVEGKEVITSPYTFSATAAAILHARGIPVFADVDPRTFTIIRETVRPLITDRTGAILPVSLFGYRPDYDREFGDLGIPIIEDGCQAVGAKADGLYMARSVVAQAMSFNGGKNCPGGEGGALLCRDQKFERRARLIGNHAENFGTPYVGWNYRMPELTACVVKHGLDRLHVNNEIRRIHAHTFAGAVLAGPRLSKAIEIPWSNEPLDSHVFYVVPLLLKRGIDREKFVQACRREGIEISGGYITPPLHHYEAFKRFAKGPLPVVEELSFKSLCLLTDFTPDKNLSHAENAAKAMESVLRRILP